MIIDSYEKFKNNYNNIYNINNLILKNKKENLLHSIDNGDFGNNELQSLNLFFEGIFKVNLSNTKLNFKDKYLNNN